MEGAAADICRCSPGFDIAEAFTLDPDPIDVDFVIDGGEAPRLLGITSWRVVESLPTGERALADGCPSTSLSNTARLLRAPVWVAARYDRCCCALRSRSLPAAIGVAACSD